MYKAAPNKLDQAQIKKWVSLGYDDVAISQGLMIELPSVQSWCKHFRKQLGITTKSVAPSGPKPDQLTGGALGLTAMRELENPQGLTPSVVPNQLPRVSTQRGHAVQGAPPLAGKEAKD
jgi:hypothetical protein